jgi:ribonuclease HI
MHFRPASNHSKAKAPACEAIADFGLRIANEPTTIRNPQSTTRNRTTFRPLPSNAPLPTVQLFTDGACSGNPGPGGWAFILRHPASEKEMERSGGEPQTTNNRMELTAAVRGLEALKRRSQVELLTDSVYVGKGISEWLPKWKANGWRRKEKNKLVPIANEELWRELDGLLAKHVVKYTRVAGHSGHAENDRVDELAVAAYQRYL